MQDLLIPLLGFAVVMSITPGPNNIMVTASGATYGFRRTLPHLFGIGTGFPVMIVAVGWGLGSLFVTEPVLHLVLKYAGAGYLLYLAYRIGTAGRTESGAARGRPLSFLEAAAFQWVNVKAWAIVVSAASTYTSVGGNPFLETLLIAAVFGLVTLPCTGLWALFGIGIGRLMRSQAALRAFNVTMAVLLVASLAPIFL